MPWSAASGGRRSTLSGRPGRSTRRTAGSTSLPRGGRAGARGNTCRWPTAPGSTARRSPTGSSCLRGSTAPSRWRCGSGSMAAASVTPISTSSGRRPARPASFSPMIASSSIPSAATATAGRGPGRSMSSRPSTPSIRSFQSTAIGWCLPASRWGERGRGRSEPAAPTDSALSTAALASSTPRASSAFNPATCPRGSHGSGSSQTSHRWPATSLISR